MPSSEVAQLSSTTSEDGQLGLGRWFGKQIACCASIRTRIQIPEPMHNLGGFGGSSVIPAWEVEMASLKQLK